MVYNFKNKCLKLDNILQWYKFDQAANMENLFCCSMHILKVWIISINHIVIWVWNTLYRLMCLITWFTNNDGTLESWKNMEDGA